MKNGIYFLFIIVGLSFFFAGCQSNEIQNEPTLELSQDTIVCLQTAVKTSVSVKTNVEWSATVQENAGDWCKVITTGSSLEVTLTENKEDAMRTTDVVLTAGPIRKKLRIKQLGQQPDILVANSRINLNYRDTLIEINVVSNVTYDIVIPDTIDWIVAVPQARSAMQEFTHSFRILKNSTEELRFTNISFELKSQNLKRDVMITQNHRDKTYNPGSPDEVGDIFIPISRGEANQAQPNSGSDGGIEFSFDGNTGTWYHSPWTGTKWPVILSYYFDTPQTIDYFVYKPRISGDNGLFGRFDLYVVTGDNTTTKINSFDFKESSSPTRIEFETPLTDIKEVRFEVQSGKGGYASCDEMEFYRNAAALTGLDEVFADKLYSELKSGVTQKQVDGIENSFFRSIAQSLLDGTYDTKYRVQEYEAYRPIEDLVNELKTSTYCSFENATGIWFKENEEIIIIVGDTHGEQVALNVYDFDRTRRLEKSDASQTIIPLSEGINKVRIPVRSGGLAYINYFTPNWKQVLPVKIHIPSGCVNGYFDKNKNSAADWMNLLNSATYGCIDIKGDHVNLVYGVGSLKRYCKDGMQLIRKYDELTSFEHEVMGLIKYKRQPKNHMFARVVFDGLFADDWGAGFAEGTMNELADPAIALKQGVWCIAHELGHVNQIRPGLKWVSTTEVTNNVYSVCARYKYNREYLNLEQERVNDGDNNNVLGGRFNSYLNYGIVKGEQWLCQRGQDKMNGYENGGDHFVKLCPLWQLLLYYREIAGKPDWYGDVAEIVRNTNEDGMTNGQLQLNFMRNTCDVVKEDLTDFFIKAGMLKPIDKDLDDYARGQMTITQEQCNELVRYASKYPKPATPVLYYLSGNSEEAYKKRLDVVGTYNEGVSVKPDNKVYISHSIWKNVAVFEIYEGDKLAKVALVGTDSPDLSKTLVFYPSGSTAIYAVAWNGKRTLVYGRSNGIEKQMN